MSAFIDLGEIMVIILSNIFFFLSLKGYLTMFLGLLNFLSLYFLPMLAGTAHC